MKRIVWVPSILLYFTAITPVGATDVSTWAGLATTDDINVTTDIAAEGSPSVISLNASTEQTIDGNNHSLIGALGYSFSVNNTADLTFKNFGKHSTGSSDNNTFSYKNLSGDTVYTKIDGSVNSFRKYFMSVWKPIVVNVENSVFANNGNEADSEARLLPVGSASELNVRNTIFHNNTTKKGGALIDGKNINVEDSIFYGNKNLTSPGGAINSRGTITIKNSYFINNHSDDDWDGFGGAIQLRTGSFDSTIEGSKFEGNTAYYDGGAIALEGPGFGQKGTYVKYIKNSEFINNSSWQDGAEYGYDGGAIATDGGFIETVDNVVFDGNKAGWHGGGLWMGIADTYDEYGHIQIKNSTFKNNEAGLGGGMYIEYGVTYGNKHAYITDSEFTGNTVTNVKHYTSSNYGSNSRPGGYPAGGALVVGTSSREGLPFSLPTTINNVLFSNNIAVPHTTKNYSAGGAVYFLGITEKNPLAIVDSTFTENSAYEGGALFSDNADTMIIADKKDVEFSGNTASGSTDTYNAGGDIYFQANDYGTLSLNAAEDRKIVFNGTIASYTGTEAAATMNINNENVTYNTYDGTTETPVTAGTTGEIQFNNTVGDEEGNIFDINLYSGTLSIGQNATINATVDNPDGFINNNNFYVKGASTLNTANGVIGSFAPRTFSVDNALNYRLDIDLNEVTADKLVGATIGENGSVTVSSLNIIADSDTPDLKVTYSDTNINGSIKDDYSITTSTTTYDVTAENDDTGSHLVLTKREDVGGGLPAAIMTGSDAYSITDDQDEIVKTWSTNDLKANLSINGNNHGIVTENGLDGINVGSAYTLTMDNVSNMSGFNYAIFNEGTVALTNSTISDDIINNGTLEINNGVSLGAVSGTGAMNINSDHTLTSSVSGNTVNVNSASLSGINYLGSDTTLNVMGGTVNLTNGTATVGMANFDADSTLALTVNSLTDYGILAAKNITVADGATLQVTLAQGIVKDGKTASLQLLSADNSDFNNFEDVYDNNMYHFEKEDKNGKYTIALKSSAEDIVIENGGKPWVADAAKAYVDSGSFPEGTTGARIADQLAALAQNDAQTLISEIRALAPTEMPVVHNYVLNDSSRLFRAVDSYLRGYRDPMGMSAGDTLSDVSIWAKPYYGKSKITANDAFEKQKSYSKGIIAGIEGKINPDVKLGFGLHYDDTEVDMLRRDLDVDTVIGFMYGEYQINDWFINGLVSYGLSDYDEKRLALGTRYTADYDVHTTSVATTVGYQFKYLIPEVGLRYYRIRRGDYTDTAGQHVHRSNANYMRSVAGIRYTQNFGKFTPDIYGGLSYDLKSLKDNTFVDLSNGSSYIVNSKRLPRLGYEFNLGLNTYLNDNIILGISLMSVYRKDYQEYTGTARLKYNF